MIHFDFKVDDIDAENIMDCISQEICKCNEKAMKALSEGKQSEFDAYNTHADYLKNLKSKMTNTRISENRGCDADS